MFSADIFILEAVGFTKRGFKDPVQVGRDGATREALNLGQFGQGLFHFAKECSLRHAELAENRRNDALFLDKENFEEVFGLDLRIRLFSGQALGLDQSLLSLDCQFVVTHGESDSFCQPNRGCACTLDYGDLLKTSRQLLSPARLQSRTAYVTDTLICLGLISSRFGITTFRIPSL